MSCTGSCNQGRDACDCEYLASTFPDHERVIHAPKPAPAPNYRTHAARWALSIAIALYLAMALLLRLCGARSV